MNKQKLKPGHFWAEVWIDQEDKRKKIVVDVCGNGCITVMDVYLDKYFKNEIYDVFSFPFFQKIEPPAMRYMTAEEMAEFILDNPCIFKNKFWENSYFWVINLKIDPNFNPKDWLWKKRFSDEWQEFLTEDKE